MHMLEHAELYQDDEPRRPAVYKCAQGTPCTKSILTRVKICHLTCWSQLPYTAPTRLVVPACTQSPVGQYIN